MLHLTRQLSSSAARLTAGSMRLACPSGGSTCARAMQLSTVCTRTLSWSSAASLSNRLSRVSSTLAEAPGAAAAGAAAAAAALTSPPRLAAATRFTMAASSLHSLEKHSSSSVRSLPPALPAAAAAAAASACGAHCCCCSAGSRAYTGAKRPQALTRAV
eukprot:3828-Heterococcus_DN1.PRE.2